MFERFTDRARKVMALANQEAQRFNHEYIGTEHILLGLVKAGKSFADALSERAAAGVKVHVLIDSYGSGKVDQHHLKQMQDAGAQVIKYHPVHWYALTASQKANNRTHRKLLIVDGQVGFTGGAGIADEWLGNAQSPKQWRDTHYRVSGPVVAQLQAAFCDNWMETTGKVLQGDDYFPRLDDAGKQSAQVFKSSPEGGSESMELMHLLSLAAAKKNIRLASAYFVPDRLTIQTLIEARKRGVAVQIIVPGEKIDVKIVRRASRARWGELLESGVEIHEYQPTMFHCKLMVIDELWTSIGSANLDNRSFRLNDEANLNVMDREFALEQIRLFEDDLSKCKRIDYEQWRKRPGWEKLMEGFTTIFGFLM